MTFTRCAATAALFFAACTGRSAGPSASCLEHCMRCEGELSLPASCADTCRGRETAALRLGCLEELTAGQECLTENGTSCLAGPPECSALDSAFRDCLEGEQTRAEPCVEVCARTASSPSSCGATCFGPIAGAIALGCEAQFDALWACRSTEGATCEVEQAALDTCQGS